MNSIRFTFIETEKDLLLDNENTAIDHYCSLFAEPPVTNGQVPGVAWKPEGHERRKIRTTITERSSDLGPIRPRNISLAVPPPSSLRGRSCVYAVHLMDRYDPSKPVPIPRFAKTDPKGTLVISQTSNLALRIMAMRSAILKKIRHGEWGLFHHVYDISGPLQKIYGPREEVVKYLILTYVETKPALLNTNEAQAFNDYIELYAEAPPDNCQIPGNKRRTRR